MLRPGPGTRASEVAQSQRERLFGAMVASVAERGYAGTRVSDLVELSGVSSRTFYDLFADKHACFVATIEAMLAIAIGVTAKASDSSRKGGWEESAAAGLATFGKMVTNQPAAARLCLIEAYAAGPDALKPLEDAIAEFEALAQRTISESPEHAGMPAEMIAARTGGLLEIARNRLRHGTEDELPELMGEISKLVQFQRPPPEPLRFTARLPAPREEDLEAYSHAERALRAFSVVVAEKGYTQATIDEVVTRASMSATTFYANFSGKEDALMAAIESAGAQIVAAVVPAFERNPDWPSGVRAAFGTLFSFLAARPALAKLMGVEVYGAGSGAMDRRARALAPLGALVDNRGLENDVHLSKVAFELIAGEILALVSRQIRRGGPQSLPSLAPVCTYIVLAPLIGAEEATAFANEDGQARQRKPGARPMRPLAVTATRTEVLTVLSEQAASTSVVAKKLNKPVDEIAGHVDALELSGFIEAVEEGSEGDGAQTYRIAPTVMNEEESAALSPARRRLVTLQILGMIRADIDRALAADTFDRRPDHDLLRMPLVVDEAGWTELHELHDRTLYEAFRIKELSARRMEESGEKGIHARSIQLFFEMPPP